jgi:hypothetical protein
VPVEAELLSRPEALRPFLAIVHSPEGFAAAWGRIGKRAELVSLSQADVFEI